MFNEETQHTPAPAQAANAPDPANDELADEMPKSNWREAFRTAFDKARRQQKPIEHRKELSRDKSKALVLVVGASVALLLIFFGVFSSPKKRTPLPGETPRGQASLGRKVSPGQENNDAAKSVAPLLSADVRSTDPGSAGQVTPEDVGRTSRTAGAPLLPPATAPTKNNYPQDYALSKVDFSDPAIGQGNNIPYPPAPPPAATVTTSEPPPDLKKPSLVFVRATEPRPTIKPSTPGSDEETLALAAGTRLVARLQAPVSSAVATPVVAVVEYNYERNGQIVLPAGAKVFGKLTQVTANGYVGIQFTEVEMTDGTSAKIDASAMDLNYGPLKGYVSGKKTGTRFLVRSLTGLGTIASYVVGPQGSSSAGLISANTLMRERLADNIASAGQEQLNGLAFNQNLVVTIPGNTRFYVVVQKPSSNRVIGSSGTHSASLNTASAGSDRVPTLEELRQLLQLRRLRLAIIGLFQWAGLMGVSIIGLQYIGVGRAAVLAYTMQLWALPLGWLISRDRITRMSAVGGIIGFVGIVLMVNPSMIDWHDGRVLLGNGLMLVSAVDWAIGSCLYRRRRWQTSFWTQTFWQIAWSALAFICARTLFAHPRPIAWSVPLVAIIVFNWFLATALCAWWWAKVLTTMPVARAGQVVSLIPVLIIIAGATFFGEKITPGLLASMFFIIFGIFLTLRSRL